MLLFKVTLKRKSLTQPMIALIALVTYVPVWRESASGQASQHQDCLRSEIHRSLSSAVEAPQLGVEYKRVAKFGLATRKSHYRIGEMISIDLAVLNNSEEPLFFYKDFSDTQDGLQAQDQHGNKIDLRFWVIPSIAIASESYTTIKPGDVVVKSLLVLCGCNLPELLNYDQSMEELYDSLENRTEVFEACLAATKAGRYTISAKLENHHVVHSDGEPNFKTAVGMMRSQPLTITIWE